VLKQAGLVAAEDTRHSRHLLDHFHIAVPMLSCHDFNERDIEKTLLEHLRRGTDVALISDAGTPLISDPGYRLVKSAHAHGIRVVPIPGPSALITALCAAGLPTDRFVFEGFPPEKHAARLKYLQSLASETRTMVFYEAAHRIEKFLSDAMQVLGPDRAGVIARELTKKFESIKSGQLRELSDWLKQDENHRKGEFVILVHGAPEKTRQEGVEAERMLALLLEELPLKAAARVASRITGVSRNSLYQFGLKLQGR
jgi:16S rRNA (cytidine1402-2'-O)-methyltransferase